MSLLATPNVSIPLHAVASDGATTVFAQAKIYDAIGGLVTTIPLPHVVAGLYVSSYTPPVEGLFTIVYKFFTDAGFTIPAVYDLGVETLDVNSVRTNILRLLGLLHENSVIDLNVYDGDENLLSARVRCYDSSVNAAAASAVSPAPYVTGLRFEYTVTATYTGGLLNKYVINRVT